MLSVEAANVGVVDLMRCVVVDVVHGCCVVCSPGVSCLIVNCAEFCVGADVHSVCVCANLLMLFQLAVCGGDVGPWSGDEVVAAAAAVAVVAWCTSPRDWKALTQ